MAKSGSKSSASAGTRKKHARRAAESHQEQPPPVNKDRKLTKQQRAQMKETRPSKAYIPPVKPAPAQLDPLEATGLAYRLPGELVIVLRKLGKKAEKTKVAGLEELKDRWIDGSASAGEDVLIDMLSVWIHHAPSFFIHQSRRIRLLSASIHASLVHIPAFREHLIFTLKEVVSTSQGASILGTWYMAAHDFDRAVAAAALRSWDFVFPNSNYISITSEPFLLSLISVLQRSVLDPDGLHLDLYPPAPPAPITTQRKSSQREQPSIASSPAPSQSKGEEPEEDPRDRNARLRISGLGALRRILVSVPNDISLSEELQAFLSHPSLWTCLHHAECNPISDGVSFGYSQPGLRRCAWAFVESVVGLPKKDLGPLVPLLSCSILRSAWVESDSAVLSALWQPILKFLKAFPNAWEVERLKTCTDHGDEDDRSEDSDQDGTQPTAPSLAFKEFLQFLENGCNGSPVQGYPAVLLVVSTIPSSIFSSVTSSPLNSFFVSFWKALNGHVLSSMSVKAAEKASQVFMESLLECTLFLAKRVRNDWKNGRECPLLKGGAGEKRMMEEESAVKVLSDIICTQFQELWQRLCMEGQGRLRAKSGAAAKSIAHTLDELKKTDPDVFKNVWESLAELLRGSAMSNPRPTAEFLKVLSDMLGCWSEGDSEGAGSEGQLKGLETPDIEAVRELIMVVIQSAAQVLEMAIKNRPGEVESAERTLEEKASEDVTGAVACLTQMLDLFGRVVFKDVMFADFIDDLAERQLSSLLATAPELLLLYLRNRDRCHDMQRGREQVLRVWHALLEIVVSPSNLDLAAALERVWSAVKRGNLPGYLRPSTTSGKGVVDAFVRGKIEQTMAPIEGDELDEADKRWLLTVLVFPNYFLSEDGYMMVVTMVAESLHRGVDALLKIRGSDTGPNAEGANHRSTMEVLGSVVELVDMLVILDLEQNEDVRKGDIECGAGRLSRPDLAGVLTDLFLFSFLVPKEEAGETVSVARNIWSRWRAMERKGQEEVVKMVMQQLRSFIVSVDVAVSAGDIFDSLEELSMDGHEKIDQMRVFPEPAELDEMLLRLPDWVDPSLAVIEPLLMVWPPPAMEESTRYTHTYDSRGLSAYARVVDAILLVLNHDRPLLKAHCGWALRHFFALSTAARDVLYVAPASDKGAEESKGLSPFFAPCVVKVRELEELVERVEMILAYVFASSDAEGDDWRAEVLDSALGPRGRRFNVKNHYSAGTGGMAAPFVTALFEYATSGKILDARLLAGVLRHVLSDAGAEEADRWMQLARKMETGIPLVSIAIVNAISQFAPVTPSLDRFRNELAASLMGISPQRAGKEGLANLRKLAGSAPGAETDAEFLPVQRAVNVVKSCQRWVAGDEGEDEDELDTSEELEGAMAMVFVHLAPILQSVPGAHWEFIFDVVESNLENSSFREKRTLPMLAMGTKLVMVVQDLALTNKSLRALWEERQFPILTVVKDLAAGSSYTLQRSTPQSVCRGLLLSVMQTLPSSLVDQDTLSKIVHIIMDSSEETQKSAYCFLKGAAQKRTEHCVIEAGTDEKFIAEIPSELLSLVQHVISLDNPTGFPNVFGYLLGWMLLLDLFEGASLKVRMNYIEQLRGLDLISLYFLPSIIGILRLDQSPSKAFKLDQWAVDEFYVEYFEGAVDCSLPILAAHLYYRTLLTLPSLVRSWLFDCKDRQLSTAITNCTSQYFSAVIIHAELAHVKQYAVKKPAGAGAEEALADEHLTIKVANSLTLNEVSASYLVDEHQLEIKLKVPNDWPLHMIEVKETKRVGVEEKQWRGWVLAVQQVIWSHNGTLVDGIALFKKNVELHFQGQVECAICYSIIGAVDGSLPKKPCRTCKNRFHSGCLYKWFNSSHSSSCPLCRSDMF